MKSFEKARAEMLQHNSDGAERELKKAVHEDPKFAEAWLQLGKLQEASDSEAAQDSFSKSLALDPRHSVLNTEQLLAVILARKGDFAGALEHLRSSLTYVPPGPNLNLLKQQIAQLEGRVAKK